MRTTIEMSQQSIEVCLLLPKRLIPAQSFLFEWQK